MNQVRQFIDMVASDQMADAKDVMDEMLSSSAFVRMEELKHNLAASLFGQSFAVSESNEDKGIKLKMSKKLSGAGVEIEPVDTGRGVARSLEPNATEKQKRAYEREVEAELAKKRDLVGPLDPHKDKTQQSKTIYHPLDQLSDEDAEKMLKAKYVSESLVVSGSDDEPEDGDPEDEAPEKHRVVSSSTDNTTSRIKNGKESIQKINTRDSTVDDLKRNTSVTQNATSIRDDDKETYRTSDSSTMRGGKHITSVRSSDHPGTEFTYKSRPGNTHGANLVKNQEKDIHDLMRMK